MSAGQANPVPPGLPGVPPQAGDQRAEPVVHYSYLGMAILLYGTLAGWSVYYVNALAARLELGGNVIPAFSRPLFGAVSHLGALLFLPLGAFVLAEVVLPRRLTRLWLASTLVLILLGLYVAIAIWFPAQRATVQ